jgi:hypothetical protein
MTITIIQNVFNKDVVTPDKTGKLSYSVFPVITEYDKENERLIAYFSNGTKAIVNAHDKTLHNTAAIAIGWATCYKIDHCPEELPRTGWVEFDEIIENRYQSKINAAITN